jgi:hypothetical protein
MIGAALVILVGVVSYLTGIAQGRHTEQVRAFNRDRNDVRRATQTASVSALEKANLRLRVTLRAVCDAYSALPQDDLLIRRCERDLEEAQRRLDTLTYLSLDDGGHAL